MERIYQDYRKQPVEVAFVVSQASGYNRPQLPDFGREFNVSFTVLDDRDNTVVSLYKLNPDGAIMKDLVIDRQGIVRLVGEFTPWTEMAASIESALGRPKYLDLSTSEKAMQALRAPRAYRRWRAAQVLGQTKDGAAVEPLIKALSDESGNVRELAAEALGKIAGPKAVEPLLVALEDKSSLVRLAVIKSLGQIRDIRAIPPLVKLLPDLNVQANAADALAEINQPELVEKALETSRDTCKGSERLALAALGQAYTQRKAYDAAVAMYQKAAEITPAVEKYESRLYALRLAECYIQKGDVDKAVEQDLSVIRDASPDVGYLAYLLPTGIEKVSQREVDTDGFVQRYEQQGKLKDAASALERKLSSSPKDVVLFETLGATYTAQQLYDKACEIYEKAVTLEPDSFVTHSHLASAYVRAGRRDQAIQIANKMAKLIRSADEVSYGRMARVYSDCGLYEDAIAFSKNALWLSRNDFERAVHRLWLGRSYESLGRYSEAIAEYENASKLGYLSLIDLADAYKRQGNWEKARATYKEAAKRSPDLHVKLGDLYRSRGMLDEAIAEYDASKAPVRAQIERGSRDAYAYNDIAWFYVTKKIKPQEAVSLAKKAVELAPVDLGILDTLGWAYLRNGQFAEALETFRKILVSQPGAVLFFSGWRAVAEIARSSVEGGVFLRFCSDMNELSKSMADEVASEHTLLWVHGVLAQFHEHRGEKEKAEEQWRKAGFMKTSSWLLIGPFDNVGGSGFFKAYPPEQSIDLHATYQARGTKIGWAELNPDSYGAFVDLEEVFDDNQWAVAYAFARVHSAQETQAQLRVGSDDDVKAWLNGKEVLSTNVARVAVIDQDVVPVNLKEGTNEILLKVCNRAGGWGFHLRMTDSQGRPLEGLTYIPAADLRNAVPE